MNEEQSLYWKNWLESYGCKEFTFNEEVAKQMMNAQISKSKLEEKIKNEPFETEHEHQEVDENIVCSVSSPSESKEDDVVENGEGKAYLSDVYTCSICLLSFEMSNSTPESSNQKDIESGPDSVTAEVVGTSSRDVEMTGNVVKKDSSDFTTSDQVDATDNNRSNANGNDTNPENSVLVRYPCRGLHYFHANCLKSWLNVSSVRGMDRISCPCCRESPTNVNASTGSDSRVIGTASNSI